jgi:tRNA G18 (ribose-2'-O)-methylase SpoU
VIRQVAAGDPCLHPYAHVGDPDWLRREGLFVAEGRLVVERLLRCTRFGVVSVLVTPSALEALRAELSGADVDVCVCDRDALKGVTGFNFHRGCLALARRPSDLPYSDLLGARRLLALEGVGNPDNVGGLFRTAAAFGVDAVLLDPAAADPLYRKAIRTSMAATLRVRFARLDQWPGSLQQFRTRGVRLVALTPRADAAPVAEFAATLRPGDRLMVLVGAEGRGLSDEVLAVADACVRIPMDAATDSLNVTVAAGIALDRLRESIG